jgi:hypothetical protein
MREHHEPKQKSLEFFEVLSTYRIIIEEGRVFNRRGREYKAINEISGRVPVCVPTKSKTGPIYRYQVIWWKATGQWPILTIHHLDDIPHHDWFSNLVQASQGENNYFKIAKGVI